MSNMVLHERRGEANKATPELCRVSFAADVRFAPLMPGTHCRLLPTLSFDPRTTSMYPELTVQSEVVICIATQFEGTDEAARPSS